MSTNDEKVSEQPGDFELLDHYERLLKLRQESPDAFMLQTSQATRYALAAYERQKSGGINPKATKT